MKTDKNTTEALTRLDGLIKSCIPENVGDRFMVEQLTKIRALLNTHPEPTLKSSEGFESVRNVLNEYVVDFEICEIVDGENIDCNRQKSLDYITNVILSTITPTPEIASEGDGYKKAIHWIEESIMERESGDDGVTDREANADMLLGYALKELNQHKTMKGSNSEYN